MEFSSFLTSLGTSAIIFVVLMLLFAWLSRKPGNDVVYYPNRILKGLELPESRTRNPFSWIKEAVSSTESDVVAVSGVDTAVYFVFLTTSLTVLLVSGILLLPTLLPIAYTDRSVKKNDTTSNGTFNQLDNLSMGHVGEPRVDDKDFVPYKDLPDPSQSWIILEHFGIRDTKLKLNSMEPR